MTTAIQRPHSEAGRAVYDPAKGRKIYRPLADRADKTEPTASLVQLVCQRWADACRRVDGYRDQGKYEHANVVDLQFGGWLDAIADMGRAIGSDELVELADEASLLWIYRPTIDIHREADAYRAKAEAAAASTGIEER